MKKNKAFIPVAAILFGLFTIGGTALAFNGEGGLFDSYLGNFSASQQEAIQKSVEIRKQADEDAKQLLDEAGISMEDLMNARKEAMKAHKEKMDQIFENNDYEAFLEEMKDKPFGGDISKDDFAILTKAHDLAEAGDKEGARKLLEDAEIDTPMFGGEHGHKGMGGMMRDNQN